MPGELSLLIKNALLKKLEEEYGSITTLRQRIHCGDNSLLDQITFSIDRLFDPAIYPLKKSLSACQITVLNQSITDSYYIQRIKEQTLEAVYGEPLCPPLKILSEKESSGITIPGNTLLLVIIADQLPNVTNEIYPLMVDAYIHDLETRNAPHHTVICVHTSWLTNQLEAMRAILFDQESGDLLETPLNIPLQINQVLFLCISSASHQLWSERFSQRNISIINPYQKVKHADDKYDCYQRWVKIGVQTPEAKLILAKDIQNKIIFFTRLQTIFEVFFPPNTNAEALLILQPNHGTEGRGIKSFSGSAKWQSFLEQNPDIYSHALEISLTDDLLLRRGVGNALYCENEDSPGVHFDIRLNVINGRAESGFLMLAKPGEIISSPGAGGHILELKTSALQLQTPDGKYSLTIGSPEWKSIEEMAQKAVKTFDDIIFAGVDIRLDLIDKKIIPWILDINPRPAGLSHSRYIDSFEPGISRRLWKSSPCIDSE